MDLQLIGLLSVALGAAALWNMRIAFSGFVLTTLLGSAAAVILTSFGGLSIQPAHILLGVLAMITTFEPTLREKLIRGFVSGGAGTWIVVTALYGAATALFLPRFFAGQTYINAIGVTEFGLASRPLPLGPTTGNLTQSLYFAADAITFLVTYAFGRMPGNIKVLTSSLIAYSILNIGFALADLATHYTGTAYLLDFIRNSSYQLHVQTEVLGFKRIAGSFTETSAFAYASVGSMAFVARLWLAGYRPFLTFACFLTTATLLMMSTSTTAYLALAGTLAVLLVESMFLVIRRQGGSNIILFATFAPLILLTLVLAIGLSPSASEYVANLLEFFIFGKALSESGIERAQWNTFAMQNFLDTYGLGAGVGSVRASSFPIAVLANLGMLGAMGYALFILKAVFSGRAPDTFSRMPSAASRSACIALLISATVSGALIDLGLIFFVYAGLAAASSERTSTFVLPTKRAPQPLSS